MRDPWELRGMRPWAKHRPEASTCVGVGRVWFRAAPGGFFLEMPAVSWKILECSQAFKKGESRKARDQEMSWIILDRSEATQVRGLSAS